MNESFLTDFVCHRASASLSAQYDGEINFPFVRAAAAGIATCVVISAHSATMANMPLFRAMFKHSWSAAEQNGAKRSAFIEARVQRYLETALPGLVSNCAVAA